MAASVTMNDRSVAMLGWIIPAPFATPNARIVPSPIVAAAETSFGFVSVVMIAREKSSNPSAVGAISLIALPMRSMGSCHPITPVLATAISCGEHPTAAAAAVAIAAAFRSPSSPVHAFAMPELATIARSVPDSRCFRVRTHGAAMTWFVVKTPAAVHGRSDTMSPTSSRSATPVFTPALAAPARNPPGAFVMATTGAM
jgi:hypothetical protein